MKKKTSRTLSTFTIVILICICAFLAYKLNDTNGQIEKLKESKGEEITQVTTQSQVNTDTKQEVKAEDERVAIYEDAERDVTIALLNFKSTDNRAHQHVVISLETIHSTDYMYGTFFENNNQLYLHFQQDIGELRLNGIDGIEIEENLNGGTNVKISIDENAGTLKIGNGTLKKI